tara:strand:+ start:32877 stop:33494 length:618 start_codon:yes stop_codon:yes gene_type:complete
MSIPYARQLIAVLLCSSVVAVSAVAAPGADELIAQAQERAAKITEYREVLNHPDQNVRLAALDIMLKSEDPVMREIAYNQAFISADETMRAVALRNRLKDLSEFTFTLSLTEKPTELEKTAILENLQGIYGIAINAYDVDSGKISEFNDYYRNTGQVSGTSLVLDDANKSCRGDFTLGDGPTLVGTFTCTHNKYKGTYKATAKLI